MTKLNFGLSGERRVNFFISVGIIAFCLLLYFYIIPVHGGATRVPQSAIFPKTWTVMMLVAAAIHLVVLFKKPDSYESVSNIEKWPREVDLKGLQMIMVVLFYIFVLVETIGYYVSTMLFLNGCCLLLGERNILRMVLVSVLLPLAIFFLFEKTFSIYLPRGILF